jgi:hypothetical protein
MDQDSQRRSHVPDLGPIEDSETSVRLAPVLVRPAARLRSPILERHSPGSAAAAALESPDPDRPVLEIPAIPAAKLVLAVAWALLPATSVLLLVGWLPAVMVGVVALGARAMRHATFGFGDGFLPFRAQDGWPRGVQEDNDVRWNWAAQQDGHPSHG